MEADVKLITSLLDSDISTYKLSKEVGLGVATISDLRNNKSKVLKMRLETAIKLTEFAQQQKEMDKMDYVYELQQLQKDNGINGNLRVDIYENKEELIEIISQNADEPQETYSYMKEELDHLDDEKELYSVDIGNGEPNYYDDAKEAYESI